MKIKIISYGHKFYEEEGKMPPYHDFLFSLRDFINPFWVPELKEKTGLDEQIHEFFEKDERTFQRLDKIEDLLIDFIDNFLDNSHRADRDKLVFAFKCTGGKHRSVYFAEKTFLRLKDHYKDRLSYELDHVDLTKYIKDYKAISA